MQEEVESDEEGDGSDDEPEAESSDDEDETNTEFITLLSAVKNSEHVDQLEWIKTRLNGAADDRDEDDDWQPSPLVTLTEESELALRDKSFQKLLKKMGLVPPTNEQERYWRIPDNLSPLQLREAVADIEADTPDLPQIPSDEIQKSKVNPKRQKLAELAATLKSSDKRSERARKRTEREKTSSKKDQKRKQRTTVEDDDSASRNSGKESEDEENEGRKPRGKKTLKRKRVRMDDSEESDEDSLHIHIEENDEENEDKDIQGHSVDKSSLPQGLPGNSDKDEGDDPVDRGNDRPQELENESNNDDENAGRKRGRSEDTESDSSDDDFDVPLIRTKRPRQAVLDDDDDDE